jgi:hypothetical protein
MYIFHLGGGASGGALPSSGSGSARHSYEGGAERGIQKGLSVNVLLICVNILFILLFVITSQRGINFLFNFYIFILDINNIIDDFIKLCFSKSINNGNNLHKFNNMSYSSLFNNNNGSAPALDFIFGSGSGSALATRSRAPPPRLRQPKYEFNGSARGVKIYSTNIHNEGGDGSARAPFFNDEDDLSEDTIDNDLFTDDKLFEDIKSDSKKKNKNKKKAQGLGPRAKGSAPSPPRLRPGSAPATNNEKSNNKEKRKRKNKEKSDNVKDRFLGSGYRSYKNIFVVGVNWAEPKNY